MIKLAAIFIAILLSCFSHLSVGQQDGGTLTARSIRSHGFSAEDIFLDVQNGSYVNLVRASNPKIEATDANKLPVLFVHGVTTNANGFIVNEANVTAKNLSNIDAKQMSLEELKSKLKDEPSNKSLVYLLLNLGYRVWLMNRRATKDARSFTGVGSQTTPVSLATNALDSGFDLANSVESTLLGGRSTSNRSALDLASFVFPEDAEFWDFGFDEQAIYDFPKTVDYVLSQSGASKLNLVSHSAGGTVVLTTLIRTPELNNKIHKSLLWAPAFDLGPNLEDPATPAYLLATDPYFKTHIGSFPPDPLIEPLQSGINAICPLQKALCDAGVSFIFGYGGDQQMTENIATGPRILDTASTPEMGQLNRSVKKVKLSYRDFGMKKNQEIYGTSEPPFYDPSKITMNGMYFYGGLTDRLVPPATYPILFADLRVTYNFTLLGNEKIHWDHISFLIHEKISELLIIPALKTLAD